MLAEEVKKDQFIHWKANRMFKSWNTYGVITNVDLEDKRVYILTFDDHKESDISLNGDAIKNEIRVVDKNEVFEYLNSRNNELNDQISELNKKISFIRKEKEKVCDLISHINKKTILNQGDRIKYEYKNGDVKFGEFHRYGETKEHTIVIFDEGGLSFVNEEYLSKV